MTVHTDEMGMHLKKKKIDSLSVRCNSHVHFYYKTVHAYHCLLHPMEREPNFITRLYTLMKWECTLKENRLSFCEMQ